MWIEALRSSKPPPVVRALLAAEVLVYVGAATAYCVLALAPSGTIRAGDVVAAVLAIGFPIAMNLLHGDGFADSGLRLDNLMSSARQVVPVTVVLAGGILLTGSLSGGFHWTNWGHFGDRVLMYAFWGPAQQYLLQSFGLRRFLQAGLRPMLAAPLAAGLFAMVHAPNWPLVALAAGAGLIWCVLFLRRPNIIVLGLAHGVLAILLYYCLPESWLRCLAIGLEYIRITCVGS